MHMANDILARLSFCLTSKQSTFDRRPGRWQPLFVGARYVDSMSKVLLAGECGMAERWSHWGLYWGHWRKLLLYNSTLKESCFTMRVDTGWPGRLWSLHPWRCSNPNGPEQPLLLDSAWARWVGLETSRSPSNLCSSVTWWSIRHKEVMKTTCYVGMPETWNMLNGVLEGHKGHRRVGKWAVVRELLGYCGAVRRMRRVPIKPWG